MSFEHGIKPQILDHDDMATIRALTRRGWAQHKIAVLLDCSPRTVRRVLHGAYENDCPLAMPRLLPAPAERRPKGQNVS